MINRLNDQVQLSTHYR